MRKLATSRCSPITLKLCKTYYLSKLQILTPNAISTSNNLDTTSKSKSKFIEHFDYKLTQIQMKYLNCTQAYFKPKKTSKASRYNETHLITYKPTEWNKTLKNLLLSCGEKPPKN